MRIVRAGIAALVIGLAGFAAWALPKHQGDLVGSWFIAGPIVEGGVGPESSHLYIWLEGDAARTLFKELDAPVVEDLCSGEPAKIVGAMHCISSPKRARCTWAVDLKRQKLEPGHSC